MNNKECEFKYKCFYSDRDCNLIKDVCVHREKLTELAQLGDQYNAVVAQNKSLQGELRLYKKMVELTLQFEAEKAKSLASYDNLFQMYKDKALQELEAEND